MKKYIRERLFFCKDLETLKYIVFLDVCKAERWIDNGENVESNREFLKQQGKQAKKALDTVRNLEDLFDLLKD